MPKCGCSACFLGKCSVPYAPLLPPLDRVHILRKVQWRTVADVENTEGHIRSGRVRPLARPMRVRLGDPIGGANHALYNVADVGEVAGVFAAVEERDRSSGQNVLRKEEQRHIGPAPGTINREEAQASGRQPE